MSIERAAIRGKLAEAKERRNRLKVKAEGLCDAVRLALNTALTPVEEIDIARLDQQTDELTLTLAELAAAGGDIARLEKELA